MKLPAIQFYPGDWFKDAGVQSLSFEDKGIWLEILFRMHDSERRGVLLLNDQAMPDEALARLMGLDKQKLTTTLTTLLTYGVASREPKTGALMCRRMVRDENLRQIRQNAGKQGGNPVLLKQKPTTRVKQIPTPSVSSSVSSSDTNTAGDKPPRARNPLLDALAQYAELTDPLKGTSSLFSKCAAALALIRTASPDVTPELIALRASNYRTHFRDANISATALANNWGRCEKPGENHATHQSSNGRSFSQRNDYSGVKNKV